ncbi:MAG TPA: acyl-CoA dehydrogenase family protein [Candidatus Binatia bacterium]|nr:acyl-CoA dehydrogenase family protein [Candidatus Binatia bacterium]
MNEQQSSNDAESILSAATALAPVIQACREEIERERRLPLPLVDALKKAGVFRMTMPRDWGGAELDPLSQLRIIEALSVADASVGWCVMIGCDSGYFSGFLDQQVAREMYPDLDTITGSALTLTGRAVRVKGGYRVSGRWPFSSGCQHSAWLVGGCLVYDGDQPRLRPNGVPETRQCYLPAEAVSILDTWYTTGLRGSGSHDFTVNDCFVPEERTFSYQELKFYRSGTLYRFPMNILFKAGGVPLGVARAALDALIEAGHRPSRLMAVGGKAATPRTLRDEEFVQDAVGRVAAILGAARAYLFSTIGDIWQTLEAGREVSLRQRVDFQLVHTQVFAMCTEAVELIYKARGGSAVYTNNVLDRCLRDIVTMNQHVVNSLRVYATGGRLLLGLPAEELLL